MWSTGSSSRVSRSPLAREDDESKAPIRLAEGPLDYEPAVFCQCKKVAPRYHPGGRKFWRWVDEEPSELMKRLLIQLRDTIKSLRRETNELRSRGGTEQELQSSFSSPGRGMEQ
ncbi:hypothetical protein ACP70R_018265 [Stipagrostis hirtigluma subsp. patula]